MSIGRRFDFEQAPDVLMITFDALRYDVAERAHREGRTEFLAGLLPQGWECRHSPGNFTYAAHAALFAGFWPTAVAGGVAARPFALRFPGSRSIDANTLSLDGDNIVEGMRGLGYYTVCIGGVGFFNKSTPLGSVFPAMFDESHWRPEFGVSEIHSTRAQVRLAVESLSGQSRTRPVFLFLNVSATHPPTFGYIRGAKQDSVETQDAALTYVDRHIAPLFEALRGRERRVRAFLMSDHGTLFGEDGYRGHRVGHEAVWNVPYGECRWERSR
jgi:hypothetical protein